jgi:hypothetical protein
MIRPSWTRKQKSSEDVFEDKVRELMFKRKITYQEAASLVQKGQRSIGDF